METGHAHLASTPGGAYARVPRPCRQAAPDGRRRLSRFKESLEKGTALPSEVQDAAHLVDEALAKLDAARRPGVDVRPPAKDGELVLSPQRSASDAQEGTTAMAGRFGSKSSMMQSLPWQHCGRISPMTQLMDSRASEIQSHRVPSVWHTERHKER